MNYMVQLARRAVCSRRMEANAFFLWAALIVSAGAGFLFWNLAARFFSADDVGLASAVISLASLLSGIAGFGIGMGIVRYLSSAKDQRGMINTALFFTALTSLLIASICILVIDVWVPGLDSMRQPRFFILFILLLISTTHNLVIQMVYLSMKQSSGVFWMAIVLSILRVGALYFLRMENDRGIVVALTIATIFTNVFALMLIQRFISGYRLVVAFSGKILLSLIPYSFAINVAEFLNNIPSMLAPLVALENLGTAASANVYIAWMMGSMVLSPSTSLGQSAFSEGASEPKKLKNILRKSGIYSLMISLVLGILVFLFADWILDIFGPDYREAAVLLRWLCLAAPIRALYGIFTAAFRVQKRLWTMIFINSIVLLLFIAPQLLFLESAGLSIMGSTWMAAQGIAVLFSLVVFLRRGDRETLERVPADPIREIGKTVS